MHTHIRAIPKKMRATHEQFCRTDKLKYLEEIIEQNISGKEAVNQELTR